jgi:putative ABC transport system permease protein
MVKLAWRNLVQERARLWISVAGIAFALVLILIIGGIFAGSEEYAVAYINNVPAPLWLAQTGVENMHMSSSYLPPETARMVETIPGVEDQAGVLYGGGGVGIGDATVSSYTSLAWMQRHPLAVPGTLWRGAVRSVLMK